MPDQAPKREDHYVVRGHKGGKPVVVYSGPNAAHAEKSRHDAERSGKVSNLVTLHGYTYPPPERNKDCQCLGNPFRQTACPFGHLTECHYPQTCGEAVCAHFLEEQSQQMRSSLGGGDYRRGGVDRDKSGFGNQSAGPGGGSRDNLSGGSQAATGNIWYGESLSSQENERERRLSVGGSQSAGGGGSADDLALPGNPREDRPGETGSGVSGPEVAGAGIPQAQRYAGTGGLQGQAGAIPPPDEGSTFKGIPPTQMANWLAAAVKPDDTLFHDSPDTGRDCLCSRCGQAILARDGPAVRIWPESGGEFRYHPSCIGMFQ